MQFCWCNLSEEKWCKTCSNRVEPLGLIPERDDTDIITFLANLDEAYRLTKEAPPLEFFN